MILTSKRAEIYTARVGTQFTFVKKKRDGGYKKIVDLEGCDCLNYFDFGIGFVKLWDGSSIWHKIYKENGKWKHKQTIQEEVSYYRNYTEAMTREPEQLIRPIFL